MKNTALIFAGGTGSRMQSATKPKQFLELHGKPIIVHTIEHFENHPLIDQIVVVCVAGWEPYMEKLVKQFSLTKVSQVVTGGASGQESIFKGLEVMDRDPSHLVLIHDGVRPLINSDIISKNIETARQFGNAITTKPVIETVIQVDQKGEIQAVVDRDSCMTAVAPQSFFVQDIVSYHLQAQAEGFHQAIDSASLARHYGANLQTILGGPENIKITTPSDFYIFRAIFEARENAQIFG